MLQQAVLNQVKFKHILADSWFGSKKNMEFIQKDLGKKFIIGLKSNRLIAFSEKEAKNGQYQSLKSLDMKDKEARKVWLKDLSFPVTLLKRVFKNENGSTGILYLTTNDLNLNADQIYDIYQKRWRVEEYHKSIKQNASLSKSPTKVIPKEILNYGFSKLAKKSKHPREKIRLLAFAHLNPDCDQIS